jgi:hypothetical protein
MYTVSFGRGFEKNNKNKQKKNKHIVDEKRNSLVIPTLLEESHR